MSQDAPADHPVLPAFSLSATSGRQLSDADLRGHITVLYFYPKDDTPGCTAEGQAFRDHYADFVACGAQIFGVSRDSIALHEKFKRKYEFPFELISDPQELLCQAFGVMREKNMYGRKVMGIERSTFVLDRDGQVYRAWRKVSVDGHAAEVLAAVRELAAG